MGKKRKKGKRNGKKGNNWGTKLSLKRSTRDFGNKVLKKKVAADKKGNMKGQVGAQRLTLLEGCPVTR